MKEKCKIHPFNGPFSGTTRVSRYQQGKTNLDFTEARDSEWQWHPLGCMQVCTSLQTDNHTSTPPLIFLQAECPSCRPTNSVKALKALKEKCKCKKFNLQYEIVVVSATVLKISEIGIMLRDDCPVYRSGLHDDFSMVCFSVTTCAENSSDGRAGGISRADRLD